MEVEAALPAALLVAALLLCAPYPSYAAAPTSDELIQSLFSGALFAETAAGCHFEIPAITADLDGTAVTWSGDCVKGLVSGPGLLRGMRGEQEVFSYDGDMRNGMPGGKGVYRFSGVLTLEGQFQGASLNDEHAVISTAKSFRYEGAAKDNMPEGFGSAVYPGGVRYEGQWHRGKREGRGTNIWATGARYEGEWRAGRMSGQGVLTQPAGARYEGGFRDGKRNGHGVLSLPTGERLETEWQDDIPNGSSAFVGPDGGRYDGEIRDGRPNGQGVAVRSDGARYEGEWHDGKPEGPGTLTRVGEPPLTGTWVRGCFAEGSRRAAFGTSLQSCPER